MHFFQPISRRRFASLLATNAAVSTVGRDVTADDGQAGALRVISYNLFGGTGWPKNRVRPMRMVAEGKMADLVARELAGHAPDLITFSESPDEKVTRRIADQLGMNHVRFPSGGRWPGTMLSRLEIIEAQDVPLDRDRPKELFTRHWGRGVVRLPNGEPLVVHSAHLFPTADPSVRSREIKMMIASMKADLDADRSMLLMGDLNHGPNSAEYQFWIDAGWVDSFAEVGKGSGFTFRSDIPRWRVDYVMAAGPLSKTIVESRPLFEGAFRLRINDPQAFALSDHLPQLAVFKIAPAKPRC